MGTRVSRDPRWNWGEAHIADWLDSGTSEDLLLIVIRARIILTKRLDEAVARNELDQGVQLCENLRRVFRPDTRW